MIGRPKSELTVGERAQRTREISRQMIEAFGSLSGDNNPMHKSPAQVKDGALVQDVSDPTRFWLIGEWADIQEHAKIRKILAEELRPSFIKHIVGGKFVPAYGKVVSSTPQDILDKASRK